MTRAVQFTVTGPPVPYQRVARAGNGRAYTPPESARYRRLVALVATGARQRLDVWPPPCATAFLLVVHVFRLPPRGKQRRGDADNFLKVVADSLTGVLYDDDSQVRRMVVEILDCEVGKERLDVLVEPWP